MVSARRPMLFVQQAGVTQNVEKVSHVLSSQKLSAQAYSPVARGSEAAFLSSHNLSAVISKIFGIVIGLCLQRSNRNVDIPRSKGHLWRRAIFHFLLCFICGLLIGFTPFMTVDISSKLELDHRTSQLDAIYPVKHSVRNENLTYMLVHINGAVGSEQELKLDTKDSTVEDVTASVQVDEHRKLLIVVTPTYKRTFQAYYLNRLACTLRLVPPPLLWIVVEASIQSAETATLLRKTGVMYRHLFSDQNSTSLKGRAIHQRNLALSHIEKHRLDGIVYFADDDNIYSKDLFQQMRSIRRFGTWPVAIVKSKSMIILEGPVCNGSQVIGWHTSLRHKGVRRFYVDMSGFAFNSTILWNPKRWKRPTAEPIRQLDTVRESFQGTSFIEQVVEDETQMEGIPDDCSRVMTWNLPMEAWATPSPRGWIMQSYLDFAASPK